MRRSVRSVSSWAIALDSSSVGFSGRDELQMSNYNSTVAGTPRPAATHDRRNGLIERIDTVHVWPARDQRFSWN